MTNHQKRLSVPKSWPVERKEGTFTVKADAGPHGEAGVPLLIVLRDVLGYVDSTKEARYALGQDSVLVNGTAVSDEERPIGMFDILEFREREEYYRVFPDEGGRLALTPIAEDAAGSRLGKVVNKTTLPGGETQLTLHDGSNLRVEAGAEYNTNDSIVVSNEEKEIVAHFPYEEGALVTAVRGAHAGDIGTIDDIQVTPGSSPNNVLVTQDDSEGSASGGDAGGFETVEEYVVVIDENFTSDEGASSETASSAEQSSADSPATEPRDDGDTANAGGESE